MKKKFLVIFFITFFIFMLGVFQSVSIAEDTARYYYFDDNQRNVVYPRACAKCGEKTIAVSAVAPAYLEDKKTVTTPRGNTYEVRKSAYKKIIESGGIFTEAIDSDTGEMWLHYFNYDSRFIDFYYEQEEGKLANTSFYVGTMKYRIVPLTGGEKNATLIANSSKNGSYPFFVCSNCAGCNAGCGGYVASNGFSIPPASGYGKATSKLVIGKYCPNHTCAFIWIVNNGNFNIGTVEGIDCENEAMAGSLFCKNHTCQDPLCNKPVVGKNTTDSRSTSLRLYQGPYEDQYSNYCIDHFCKHYMCDGKRISTTNSTAEFIDGKYINFPGYCAVHGNDCTIYGCSNPVVQKHHDATNEIAVYICEYHAEQYEEMQRQAMGQIIDDDEIPDSDLIKATCTNCQRYLPQQQISTGKMFGKFIDGKWYCGICASQGFIVVEEVDDFEGEGGYSYYIVPTPAPVDPATCDHSRYPIPNTVKFTSIKKETHMQVWTCTNCNSPLREEYEHTFINGICASCGYKQDGYVPPEDELEEEPKEELIYTKPLVEIANAKYAMPCDDGTMLIQLEDSNSIELKIANDKLSVLTYKWGSKVVGYSESSVAIPSRETLLLSDGGSNISGFVMEKPNYILTVTYYTQEENARRTTITYQIYLP